MICPECKEEFVSRRKNQIYCAPDCQRRSSRPLENWRASSGSAQSGAYSELLAAAELLRQGYYVFRNMGPTGPCDLIALKNGICLRVEVKTQVPYAKGLPTSRNYELGEDYDLLALVDYNGTVTFHTEQMHAATD